MRSYLINLDRSPERLERMSALFADMEVDFIRVSAIDGKKLTQQEIDGWLSGSGNFYRLGPGEIGCFLSHRRCWELIAQAEESHAAIFEDDLHFGAGLRDVLAGTEWIPQDADIVKLETTLTRTLYQRKSAAMIAGRSIRRLCGPQSGGGGYIISRHCARILIDHSLIFEDPVDQFVFNIDLLPASNLKIYHMVPAICAQDFIVKEDKSSKSILESTLAHERPAISETMVAKFLKEIRRPFERAVIQVKALLGGMEWKKIPVE